MPCFIISGQLHHRIGSLLTDHTGYEVPVYAQVYIMDAADQDNTRTRSLLRILTERGDVSDPHLQALRGLCTESALS